MERVDLEALFILMVSRENEDEVLKRIEAGPEPVDHYLAFRSPRSGSSLFGVFVQGGDTERVGYILDNYNPDINHRDTAGQTPLIYACRLRKAPMAMFLLERGVEVDLADDHGYTPLWYSLQQCRTADNDFVPVARRMIELGADPDSENASGRTPRDRAARYTATGLSAFLKDKGL